MPSAFLLVSLCSHRDAFFLISPNCFIGSAYMIGTGLPWFVIDEKSLKSFLIPLNRWGEYTVELKMTPVEERGPWNNKTVDQGPEAHLNSAQTQSAFLLRTSYCGITQHAGENYFHVQIWEIINLILTWVGWIDYIAVVRIKTWKDFNRNLRVFADIWGMDCIHPFLWKSNYFHNIP